MANKNIKHELGYKIITNLLIWVCFGLVAIGIHAAQHSDTPNSPLSAEAITHFIDLTLYFSQLGAAALAFFLFAIFTHKSKDEAEFSRGRYFINLVFEEWAFVLINFGSLLAIAGFIAHIPIYWAGTLANYALGWWLYPKR